MNGQAHDGRHHDRIDPEVHLGPVTLAWHGITIALGFLLGGVVAARWLRRHGLDVEPLYQLIAIAAIAANRRESPRIAALGGIVGARILYVLEHDPGRARRARQADLKPRVYLRRRPDPRRDPRRRLRPPPPTGRLISGRGRGWATARRRDRPHRRRQQRRALRRTQHLLSRRAQLPPPRADPQPRLRLPQRRALRSFSRP